jgi:hypothetical protein
VVGLVVAIIVMVVSRPSSDDSSSYKDRSDVNDDAIKVSSGARLRVLWHPNRFKS